MKNGCSDTKVQCRIFIYVHRSIKAHKHMHMLLTQKSIIMAYSLITVKQTMRRTAHLLIHNDGYTDLAPR